MPSIIAQDFQALVAPHAGAWIETAFTKRIISNAAGRAPRGRVD